MSAEQGEVKYSNRRARRAALDEDDAVTGDMNSDAVGIAAAPAARAPAGPVDEETGKPLTRRSRRDGQGAVNFDLPENSKRQGWDYEWKTHRIVEKDVEGAEIAHIHEQGWRPVPASQFPSLCPPGYEGRYIDRWGQRLYMRPMSLTLEARQEDYDLAEKTKMDKLTSATHVPNTRPGLINATAPEVAIEGVVGAHRAKPAA